MTEQESRAYLKKSLIPGRVFLVGEGRIPGEVLETLSDEHMNIFLREPDPEKWPEAMLVLTQYLSEEERIQSLISRIFSKHDPLIRDSIRSWVLMVWEELAIQNKVLPGQQDKIMEHIKKYLTMLIEECLDRCKMDM